MTRSRPATCLLTTGLCAVLVLVLSAPARATDPLGESLRLVPPDTRICLVVRDLRTHLRSFEGSPFEKWLEQSALGKRLLDPAELAKIEQLETFLESNFGVGYDQLLDDILGDALVLAYQPGPPGQPEQELGVLIVNARKPALLASLVDKLNAFQTKSGEIKSVNEQSHQGQAYFVRMKADGGREFYLLRGGVLAFSGQEAAIRQVIEQGASPEDNEGRVAKSIAALGMTGHCAVCWFDPRGFDAEVQARLAATQDPRERAFQTQFSRVWSATNGLAVYVQPGRGLELGVVASFDREKLPAEVRNVAFASRDGSRLWAVVPDDAILALGGGLDVPRLLECIGSFMAAEDRAELSKSINVGLAPIVGKDRLQSVLAGLGPDWIAWIRATPGEEKSFLPEWTAALKLTDEDGAVGRAVMQAMDFGVQIARIAYNREHQDQIDLNEQTRDKAAVKTLSNVNRFPEGLRPSYGLLDGHLVFASTPEAAFRFAAPVNARPETLWLRFQPGRLRGHLMTHRSAIAEVVSRWSGNPPVEVEQNIDELGTVLEAFDRLELHHESSEGLVRVSLRIDLVKPLKK